MPERKEANELNGVNTKGQRDKPSLKGLLLQQDALFTQKAIVVPVTDRLPKSSVLCI